MSGWERFYEDTGPVRTTPATVSPNRKRKSKLPEANKLARSIRNGCTISDLAVRHGFSGEHIIRVLTSGGWDASNGQWTGGDKKSFRRPPLTVRGDGAGKAMHHVGGGDNPNGVPTATRPFTERRRPTGFAWPVREGEPETPRPERKNPGSKPRTFRQLREANESRRKLSEDDLKLIKHLYVEEFWASTRLAKKYGVNQRTIRKALVHMGVPIRDRSAAGKIRWRDEQEEAS